MQRHNRGPWGGRLLSPDWKYKTSIFALVHSPSFEALNRNQSCAYFRWVHLPENNMSWCHDFLAKYCFGPGPGGSYKDEDFQEMLSVFKQQHCGRFAHATYMPPMCLVSPSASTRRESHNLFLAAPYLHFDTHDAVFSASSGVADHAERDSTTTSNAALGGKIFRRASANDRSLFEPGDAGGTNPSELLSHPRLTLDQSFYRGINTESRDNDQVIYKFEKKNVSAQQTALQPKILMVDQLWMWIIDNRLVETSFSGRKGKFEQNEDGVWEAIAEQVNQNHKSLKTVHQLAALILECCFGAFDKLRVSIDGLKFLEIFDAALGDAMEQETT
jgi:hypothetical protein